MLSQVVFIKLLLQISNTTKDLYLPETFQIPMTPEVIFKILTVTVQVLRSQNEHWLSTIRLAILVQTGWLAVLSFSPTLGPQPGPAPMALSSNFYLPWIPLVPSWPASHITFLPSTFAPDSLSLPKKQSDNVESSSEGSEQRLNE